MCVCVRTYSIGRGFHAESTNLCLECLGMLRRDRGRDGQGCELARTQEAEGRGKGSETRLETDCRRSEIHRPPIADLVGWG